jgi:hypothetical protein
LKDTSLQVAIKKFVNMYHALDLDLKEEEESDKSKSKDFQPFMLEIKYP